MITKTKIAIATAIGLAPLTCLAADFTSTSDASTMVGTFTSNFGAILYAALPAVLVIVASLIGISLIIRWVRRHAK